MVFINVHLKTTGEIYKKREFIFYMTLKTLESLKIFDDRKLLFQFLDKDRRS